MSTAFPNRKFDEQWSREMKHIYQTGRNDGLAVCTVCKCAEGLLPTDCPGREVSYEIQELIYSGGLNFRNGKWLEIGEITNEDILRDLYQ